MMGEEMRTPVTHAMNLQERPFRAIAEGRKTVELRLYDEKRAAVRVGDTVEFSDSCGAETLLCEVTALYRYDSFEQLYQNHDPRSIGYGDGEKADPADMLRYYSRERIDRYGVVGIGLRLK